MKGNLDKLLSVKNLSGNEAAVYIYGEIVSDWWGAWSAEDQYPEKIRMFLKDVAGRNLNIYINSPGGSVFAAMAIVNMLQRHTGYKTCYIDGYAASAASAIALCGDRLVMPRNTFLMIHRASACGIGDADEMRKYAELLEKAEEGILNVYKGALKEGASIDDVHNLMLKETWFTADEAAQYFKVEVVEPKVQLAAMAKGDVLARAPEKVKNAANLAIEFERLALLNLKREGVSI